MASSMNVGELHGSLDLIDDLTPKLERADRNFRDVGADMDVEATIGLDTSGLDEGLDDAQKRSRRSGSEIGDEVADGVSESAPSMERAGTGLGDVLVAGVVGVAAAGGLLVVDELNKAIERDAGRMQVGASLLLPPEMSRELGRQSGEVWAEGWGESEDEVGAAMRSYLINIGGLGTMTEDEFEGMIVKGLQVSDMLGEDVGATILTVGKMIRNGLVADANEGFDLLAMGASRVDATLHGELLETFDEYGANFREIGFTGPQAMGMVIASVNAGGRNIDLAADAMREFHDAMTDPASNAAARQAFVDLGLNADEMFARFRAGDGAGVLTEVLGAMENIGDQGLRDRIGTDLFSIKWLDNGAAATAAMDPMVAGLGNVDGSVGTLSANLDTNAARVESWKRTMQTNVTDFAADTLIPALEDIGWNFEEAGRKWDETWGTNEDFSRGLEIIGGWFSTFAGWLGTTVEEIERGLENLGDMIDDIEEFIGSIPGGLGGFLDSIEAIGIPGFDAGGVVPGPVGAPRIVMAHGGETILPTHRQPPEAFGVVGGGGPSGSGGGAPTYVIQGYHRSPSAILDEAERRRTMDLAPAARL